MKPKPRIVIQKEPTDRNYGGLEVLAWTADAYLCVAECGKNWNLAWKIAEAVAFVTRSTQRELS